MILSRVYTARTEIPKGAEPLYQKRGSLFVLNGASRDFVADNPWEMDSWNVTAQGKFFSDYGEAFAAAFARMAGSKIGGMKPVVAVVRPPLQVIVQHKTVGSGGGGQGTSGEGPPV